MATTTFTYDIDNSVIPEVKNAFSWYFDYTTNQLPSETVAEFTERMATEQLLRRKIKSIVTLYRQSLATPISEEVESEYDGMIT